ncbi:TonB-linked SusC/RagA family outer membrane protein [Sediminitomix flava]|uniref:TonB-linked SusC/RagA family outer membrane protein n=2 Tax=Sediminitomix flava TaxID=379075 RepID=A0A315Z9I1_SEDFL|nr:TonB-linked SusC/RagA family outer membrane protein [Sediminitomix flava]
MPIFLLGQGQLTTIEGIVKDRETGEELIGASVYIPNTTIGSTTDYDGRFKFELPKDTTSILVSYIGYHSLTVEYTGQKNLTLYLERAATEIEEIVIVGYATQKKESVVGAIDVVKSEDLLMSRADLSLSNALVGLVPGMTSIQESGQPGENAASIFIRGKSSWVDNTPLFLVDGIERDYNDIDPNEVASISVLKDASATAVFGTKGANGVILITTKEGEKGKAKFNFSHNLSFKQPISNFSMADRASVMEMKNQALFNDRVFDPSAYYSDEDIRKYRDQLDPYMYPEIDWHDELVNNYGVTKNYNINVSGGTKKSNYFISLSYATEGDIFNTIEHESYDPGFLFEKYNYRTNLNLDVTPTTNIKLGLAGNISTKNQPAYGNSSDDSWAKSDFFKLIYYKAPNYIFPIQYENGEIGHDGGGSNPYLLLNYSGVHINRTNTLAADLHLDQKLDFLAKGLSLTGKFAYNTKFDYIRTISNKNNRNSEFNVPSYLYTETDTLRFPNGNYIPGPVSVGDEKLNAYKRNLYYEAAVRYAQSFRNLHDFSALGLFMRSQSINKVKWPAFEESWVGRVTYAYDSKYFLEMNGAYNGSEKFAPGLRFGFFPSYAVGWMMSEENFIRNNSALDFIDELKLRFSYGEVGYDKSASRWTYLELYEGGGNISIGNPAGNRGTYKEGQAANPEATWEVAKKANLGFEVLLFNYFSAIVDFFNEHRTGILMQRRTIPDWFGLEAPEANIGETKSQGYEISLTWNKPVQKDFSYMLQLNMSYAENRVVFRDDPVKMPDYMKDAGKPIGSNYTLITDGLYQDWDDVYNSPSSVWGAEDRIPGDFKYIDFNGDGVIDENDKVVSDYQEYPSINVAFNFGLTYKSFQLNGLFSGVSGVYKVVPDALLYEFTNADYETANPHNLNAWSPNNLATNVPILRSNNGTRSHNQQFSDYAYQKADYLRLKRLELSYQLKSDYLQKQLGFNSLRLYVGANNLLTLTDMDDRFDPEAATLASYPLIKSYNTGLTVTF